MDLRMDIDFVNVKKVFSAVFSDHCVDVIISVFIYYSTYVLWHVLSQNRRREQHAIQQYDPNMCLQRLNVALCFYVLIYIYLYIYIWMAIVWVALELENGSTQHWGGNKKGTAEYGFFFCHGVPAVKSSSRLFGACVHVWMWLLLAVTVRTNVPKF